MCWYIPTLVRTQLVASCCKNVQWPHISLSRMCGAVGLWPLSQGEALTIEPGHYLLLLFIPQMTLLSLFSPLPRHGGDPLTQNCVYYALCIWINFESLRVITAFEPMGPSWTRGNSARSEVNYNSTVLELMYSGYTFHHRSTVSPAP